MASRTPLGALVRGVAAGLVGTACMTAHQEIRKRIRESHAPPSNGPSRQPADPWDAAPAPAKVARRLLEGILHQPVSPQHIPLLTNVMHWAYGAGWGGVYGLLRPSVRGTPAAAGPVFGLAVWAASYVSLVPMGLYAPPWEYPAGTVVNDIGYHLTYGTATATAFEVLERE
jgi:hypothetical protein